MSMDDLLKSLQVDYITALPKKIESIRHQVTAGDVDALRESFHKFKGTGRTYGLPEISILSEAIETICSSYPEHALTAARLGADLLHAIHGERLKGNVFALAKDARFGEIQNILQK